MSDSSLSLSPLHQAHLQLGAKMVPFAGFSMPVQYAGISEEHHAVRQRSGIFDISHMGQVMISGPGACAWLDGLLTNRVSKLGLQEGQYSLMLNEGGGVIDDLILYRTGEESYFLVINASKITEDLAWMLSRKPDCLSLADLSQAYAGMAVQGPQAEAVFAKACEEQWELPKRNGVCEIPLPDGCGYLCRTGYTGEDGFEFFCPSSQATLWWEKFLAAGAKPCGLGARDSLRLEMCYPLNGNDLSSERTPLEAGLGFFVDLEKDFTGGAVLKAQKESGPSLRLVALLQTEAGPPLRPHYTIYAGEENIGETSSGILSPSLGKGIALAYLPAAHSKIGTQLQIEIRGRRYGCEVVKKPFYKKS